MAQRATGGDRARLAAGWHAGPRHRMGEDF